MKIFSSIVVLLLLVFSPQLDGQELLQEKEFKKSTKIGISFGHFRIDGAVNAKVPSGIGTSIFFDQNLSPRVSLKFETGFFRSKVVDDLYFPTRIFELRQPTIDLSAYANEHVYRNYINQSFSSDVNILLHIEKFHKKFSSSRWGFSLGIGAGFVSATNKHNYFNRKGEPYNWLELNNKYATQESSRKKRKAISHILDNSYESKIGQREIFIAGILQFEFNYRITDDLNITFRRKVWYTDYRGWSGYGHTYLPDYGACDCYRSPDKAFYTSLSITKKF